MLRSSALLRRFGIAVVVSCAAVASAVVAQTTPRPVAAKDLGKYWLVASDAMEAMKPNSGVNLYTPSCAVVRYVINSDGTTSDVALEKLVPAGDLGVVATTAIDSLVYAPAKSNQALTPVLTRVTLPLNLPPVAGTPEERARIETQRAQVLAACEPPADAKEKSTAPAKPATDAKP